MFTLLHRQPLRYSYRVELVAELEATGTSSSGNLGIGVGGFGVGGDRHSGYAVSGESGLGAPILHRTAQATAIYVH